MPFIGRFISSPSSLRGTKSGHLLSRIPYTSVYLNRERNVAFGVGQALLSCAKFIYEVAWNDLKRLVSGTRLAQVTWRLVLDYRSNVVAIWTFRPYLTVSRYSLHSNFFVFSAVRSVRARVCSPLQTWLAATAEKALSEWKVILWHCDIGCFFWSVYRFGRFFSFVANEVCWKHYKDTTPSNQTNTTHCTCFTQSPLKAVQMHSSSLRPTSMFLSVTDESRKIRWLRELVRMNAMNTWS